MQGRTTSATMGMVELMYAVIRLACVRHHVPTTNAPGGGGGGVAGEASSGTSKIKWAGRCCGIREVPGAPGDM